MTSTPPLSAASGTARRVATIDVGTNTLLLLVAESSATGLRAVCDECRFGRLGQGLEASGSLDPAAVERSLDILRDYRRRISELGVDDVRAVGTQALREASNAAAFLEPAAQILGREIEVISGDREAQLSHLATVRSLPALGDSDAELVIADVGGGSTEIIVGRAGAMLRAASIPIGAVRLTERHLHGDPPGAAETQALVADIDQRLAHLDLPRGAPLVGIAGTATTIAAVELRLRDYDPERVHGFTMSPATLDRQLARHLELTVGQRRALPGMEPARADVIAAGVAIFSRLCARMSADRFVVSDRGVRWGLAYEALAA